MRSGKYSTSHLACVAMFFLLVGCARDDSSRLHPTSTLRPTLHLISTPTPTLHLTSTPTPTLHPTSTPRPTFTPTPEGMPPPTITPYNLLEEYIQATDAFIAYNGNIFQLYLPSLNSNLPEASYPLEFESNIIEATKRAEAFLQKLNIEEINKANIAIVLGNDQYTYGMSTVAGWAAPDSTEIIPLIEISVTKEKDLPVDALAMIILHETVHSYFKITLGTEEIQSETTYQQEHYSVRKPPTLEESYARLIEIVYAHTYQINMREMPTYGVFYRDSIQNWKNAVDEPPYYHRYSWWGYLSLKYLSPSGADSSVIKSFAALLQLAAQINYPDDLAPEEELNNFRKCILNENCPSFIGQEYYYP